MIRTFINLVGIMIIGAAVVHFLFTGCSINSAPRPQTPPDCGYYCEPPGTQRSCLDVCPIENGLPDVVDPLCFLYQCQCLCEPTGNECTPYGVEVPNCWTTCELNTEGIPITAPPECILNGTPLCACKGNGRICDPAPPPP